MSVAATQADPRVPTDLKVVPLACPMARRHTVNRRHSCACPRERDPGRSTSGVHSNVPRPAWLSTVATYRLRRLSRLPLLPCAKTTTSGASLGTVSGPGQTCPADLDLKVGDQVSRAHRRPRARHRAITESVGVAGEVPPG